MSKCLIVAEKPSVAGDLAKALGNFRRNQTWYERDDAIIAAARGHLIEIGFNEEEDARWELASLPVIPERFELKVIAGASGEVKTLRSLLGRSDVSTVVNACDAGREGELIFGLVYEYLRCRKPVKRLWMQSMTMESIRTAYGQMRDGKAFAALLEAARSRSEADLLIGANGTRALTKLQQTRSDARDLVSVGRVQTPTLAMVVAREAERTNFRAREFWEVHGTFQSAGGEYTGRWVNPAWQKSADEASRADRVWDKAQAEAIARKCQGVTPTEVREETKPVASAPPRLFDLTSLQREANSKWGLSAKTTLDCAQALYEKHKALTYPRTDSTALPEDYLPTVKETLGQLSDAPYGDYTREVLAGGWVKADKRIFDSSKVTDHFAIIPTGKAPGDLSQAEARVYDLVTRRFIAAFFAPAEYRQTTRETVVQGEIFRSEGRVLINEGWLRVYGRAAGESDEQGLAAVKPGERVANHTIAVVGKETQPPARHTEATLLAAMEHAGRQVDDEAMREAMKERGLGTPATRAAIIEGLLSAKKGLLLRQGKELVPTPKGMALVQFLVTQGLHALTSPRMTGEWEHKLRRIEQGELTRAAFMHEVRSMTEALVRQVKQQAGPGLSGANKTRTSAVCPKCGGQMLADGRQAVCEKGDFRLWREVAGRQLDEEELATLLRDRSLGPRDGFRSKAGKPFRAGLVLGSNLDRIDFVFEGGL